MCLLLPLFFTHWHFVTLLIMLLKRPVLSVVLRIIHSGRWMGFIKNQQNKPPKPTEIVKVLFSVCVFSVCHGTSCKMIWVIGIWCDSDDFQGENGTHSLKISSALKQPTMSLKIAHIFTKWQERCQNWRG